jgi:exonuclease III
MKYKNTFFGILLILLLALSSCGKNQSLTPPVIDENLLEFGTAETLDVITWNLKTFPLTSATIQHLVEIIPILNADVIAFQEIMDANQFYAMATLLPDYRAVVYTATSSYRLAYLYKPATVTLNSEFTIFNGNSNPFPRPPYIMNMNFAGNNYILINNHFKALGDNFIDESDPWDEEVRRRLASTMLEEYIRQNHPSDRVILLGDLNDQIQEPPSTNVFLPFLDRPDEYMFTTMEIALNPSPNLVSYPSANSMIDHILITNELFDAFEFAGSVCRAIRVEEFVGGLSVYFSQISDHRPVGVRLMPY